MYVETLGSGPPLVMVPGWAMTSTVWRKLAERLARQWRVTLIDLPGHGDNRHIPFTRETAVETLVEAAPAGAVWLAWSLGAQLTLEAAVGGADIEALVLLAATPCFVQRDDWSLGLSRQALANLRRQVSADPARGVKGFMATLGAPGPADRRAVRMLRQHLDGVGNHPDALLAGLDWLAATDLRAVLPRIGQPTWWINGALDPLVPGRVAPVAAAAMPAGHDASIDQGGHLPFMTHAERVLSVLDEVRTICRP